MENTNSVSPFSLLGSRLSSSSWRLSKAFIGVFVFLLLSVVSFAQVPQNVSFQAVVRKANNHLVVNQPVDVRLSILNTASVVVYAETHQVVTNQNGLVSLLVGSGDIEEGDFASIDWTTDHYTLRCVVSLSGTEDDIEIEGPLSSVPYAFYADNARSVQGLSDSLNTVRLQTQASLASLATTLRAEDAASADTLNAKIGSASGGDVSKHYVDSLMESQMAGILRKLNRAMIASGMSDEIDGYDNGTLTGLFSISAEKRVKFSKGNLQYQASTRTWRFAENQYAAIGNAVGNTTAEANRAESGDWIDLFGWGTSGWDNSTTAYQPYVVSITAADYSGQSLTGMNANADWGVYNAVSNGGDNVGLWRTLTKDEWEYLLTTRPGVTINGVSGNHWLKAQVMGVRGLILFPDGFVWPTGEGAPSVPAISVADKNDETFSTYMYNTASKWQHLEDAGCVFLPITSRRSNATIEIAINGYYWSSTYADNHQAYGVRFREAKIEVAKYDAYWGYAVRLVQVQ